MATGPGGLRPLGLGEILDIGIKLYLRHWRVLIACVVWVVLPVQILSVLVTLSIAPEQLDLSTPETGVEPGEEDAFLASQGVVFLLQLLVYAVATAACFKAVSDAYMGSEPSARRSLGFAVRRLPALVLVALLSTLGLILAFIALIVPAIWLAVAWSLSIPALLFERLSPVGALGRSFRLVRGRWWPVCGTLVVGVLLVSIVGGILASLLLLIPALLVEGNELVAAFATVISNTLSSVLTTPFTAAVVALIYFDQRVRKEGFDLQLLAEGLGERRDPDAPLPAPPGATPEPAGEWAPPGDAPPDSTGGWAAPTGKRRDRAGGDDTPPGDARPPDRAGGDDAPPGDAPPPERGAGGWEPPSPPRWPPDERERGSGGL